MMMIGSLLDLYGLPWLLEIMCSGAHLKTGLTEDIDKVVSPPYSASTDYNGVTKTCC